MLSLAFSRAIALSGSFCREVHGRCRKRVPVVGTVDNNQAFTVRRRSVTKQPMQIHQDLAQQTRTLRPYKRRVSHGPSNLREKRHYQLDPPATCVLILSSHRHFKDTVFHNEVRVADRRFEMKPSGVLKRSVRGGQNGGEIEIKNAHGSRRN